MVGLTPSVCVSATGESQVTKGFFSLLRFSTNQPRAPGTSGNFLDGRHGEIKRPFSGRYYVLIFEGQRLTSPFQPNE